MDRKMDPQSAKPVQYSKDCTGPYWFLDVFCFAPIVKSIVGKKIDWKKCIAKSRGEFRWKVELLHSNAFLLFSSPLQGDSRSVIIRPRTAHGKQGVEEQGGWRHPVETETWHPPLPDYAPVWSTVSLCRCISAHWLLLAESLCEAKGSTELYSTETKFMCYWLTPVKTSQRGWWNNFAVCVFVGVSPPVPRWNWNGKLHGGCFLFVSSVWCAEFWRGTKKRFLDRH